MIDVVVVVIFVCFFFDGSMSLIMLLLKRFDDWRLLDVSRNVVVEILRLILIGLIVSTKVK